MGQRQRKMDALFQGRKTVERNRERLMKKMKYDHALGSYLYQTPMSMEQKVGADGYSTKGLDGTLNPYEGYVQSRMSCFNRGNRLRHTIQSERRPTSF